jgi:AcrR family transcriptional regulator
MEAATPLERSLADGRTRATPLDALQRAREIWQAGQPLDMSALATALQTSRATLYRWVGSKERLLGEVIWTFASDAMDEARAAAPGSGPAHVAGVVERYMRGAMAFQPLRRFVEADPEYALRVLASANSPMQRRSILAVRRLLAEQVEAGKLEPPLDLDTLAFLVVRIVESYLYTDVITGGEPDVEQAAEAVHVLLSAPPRTRRSKAVRPSKAAKGRSKP